MNRDLKMKIVEIVRYGVISMAAAILLASCSSINSPANTDPLSGQEVIVATGAVAQKEELPVQAQPEDTVEAEPFEVEATQTVEPSPTPTETPVEVVEDVVAPEGFSVGEYGMLRDPSTNKELITFNPDVDWQKFREDFIKGIWQYNMDWYAFTGEFSDANNYQGADAFYEAAISGKEFTNIGIPVGANVDWGDFDLSIGGNWHGKNTRTSQIQIKYVSAKLDNIAIQILETSKFPEVVGKDSWLDPENESFSTGAFAMSLYKSFAQYVSHLSVSGGNLTLSLGSFNMMSVELVPSRFVVGNFETGIGSDADFALSDNLDRLISILHNSRLGQNRFTDKSGKVYDTVGVSRIDQAIQEEGIQYFKLR